MVSEGDPVIILSGSIENLFTTAIGTFVFLQENGGSRAFLMVSLWVDIATYKVLFFKRCVLTFSRCVLWFCGLVVSGGDIC